MATVTRENIGVLTDKLMVKVAKDDYLPSFQKAIKDYSKQANIPGFRKGMVPVGMVKKMYGSSVFADEVIKSVEKGLTDYMKNEQLNIFAQPLPIPENDSPKLDMNQPDEYQFSFEIGLKPEFSIADLAQLHITKYKVDISDKMVNDEIDHIQTRHGLTVDAEEIDSEDNELTLSFSEVDADGNDIEGGVSKETTLSLKFFAPEFRNELMGKKESDVLVTQLSKAFAPEKIKELISDLGFADNEQAAGEKFFKIRINRITLIQKRPLTEDLFELIYAGRDITTEEEFRNELKKEIEAKWEGMARNQLLDQIYHELLHHTNIEFPEDFLKRWMLNGTDKEKSLEEVEQEFPTFARQLKWSLITEKIITDIKIEVTPDDLMDFAKQQLMGYLGGSQPNMLDQPWVTEYLGRMMKDKKFVEDSYHRIQTDKVFSWAETQIHPTEVTISEDDFTKLVEEHSHVH